MIHPIVAESARVRTLGVADEWIADPDEAAGADERPEKPVTKRVAAHPWQHASARLWTAGPLSAYALKWDNWQMPDCELATAVGRWLTILDDFATGSSVPRDGFNSVLAHHSFVSTVRRRQVVEKWCRCGGSIEPISVVGDSLREEQLLQALLVVERRLHPQV
jgi:hypothetical protein